MTDAEYLAIAYFGEYNGKETKESVIEQIKDSTEGDIAYAEEVLERFSQSYIESLGQNVLDMDRSRERYPRLRNWVAAMELARLNLESDLAKYKHLVDKDLTDHQNTALIVAYDASMCADIDKIFRCDKMIKEGLAKA